MAYIHRDFTGANSAEFREAIEAVEGELGRPIRVMNGGYGHCPPTGGRTGAEGWTAAQAEACGVDRETAREMGVTLILVGTPVRHFDHHNLTVLDEGGTGEDGRTGTMMYDVQLPRDPAELDTLNITTIHDTDDGLDPWLGRGTYDRDGGPIPIAWYADRWVCSPMAPTWHPFANAGRNRERHGWPEMFRRWVEALQNALRSAAGEIDPDLHERLMERHRARFAELYQFTMNTQIPEARANIETLLEQQVRQQEELQRISNQLVEQRRHLDALILVAAGEDRAVNDPERAWQQLLDHEKVESIRLSGDNLIVTTTELTMTEPQSGRTAVVGAFQVTINLQSGEIHPRNLTGRRGTHDHPHVHHGNFCTYELKRTFAALIRRREILSVVELIIASLETVNINDDWGRFSALWFEDTENRELLLTGLEAAAGTPA